MDLCAASTVFFGSVFQRDMQLNLNIYFSVQAWIDPCQRLSVQIKACLGICGMNGNEGYWGAGISTLSQNFPKSPSILFHPLESSISQIRPKDGIGPRPL
jgi:hypothetical protein